MKEHKWMYYKRDSGYSNQVFLSKYPGNGLKSVQRGTGTNSQAGSQPSLQPFFGCHAALSSKGGYDCVTSERTTARETRRF